MVRYENESMSVIFRNRKSKSTVFNFRSKYGRNNDLKRLFEKLMDTGSISDLRYLD